jgi:transposase
MTQLTQTPQFQIDKLKIFLKTTKQPNERDRARAILKLIAGRKRKEVANFFDIHIKTLDKWQGTFKEQGIDGLRTESQIGNNYKLSQAKKEEIKTAINKNAPEELKLKGKFWTVDLLKKFVKKQYKVVYKSEISYHNLFKFCGFSYHKPNKVNKRQNPHMRQRFEDVLKKSSNGAIEKIVWSW